MNDITPYLDNMKLLSTIAGLLAGFTLSITFQFIRGEEKTRLISLTLFIFLSALGCFVILVFNSTFMVIGSNTFAFIQEKASSREALHFSFHVAVAISLLSFALGPFLSTCGIGCSGWLHFRALGLLSTAIAGVTVVLTLEVFMLMLLSV